MGFVGQQVGLHQVCRSITGDTQLVDEFLRKAWSEMYMLRIEHPVPDYNGWKRAFDSDPVGREKAGVRRYQILRPVDNPNNVIIHLEFDTLNQAEALLAALRNIWRNVEGKIMMTPQVQIVEAVETKTL